METTSKTPGDLVRDRRTRLGLTQRSAARLCGVPQSMLSRIEAGSTQPSVPTLQRLLASLGADLRLELQIPEHGGEGRREKERSLWLNRLVISELTRDPDRVIDVARDNISRWREIHAQRPTILSSLDRWSEILDDGVDAIVDTLSALTEEAEDLRQNSPFAGVVSQEARDQVIASFRAHWERRHRSMHVGSAAAPAIAR